MQTSMIASVNGTLNHQNLHKFLHCQTNCTHDLNITLLMGIKPNK